MPEAARVWVLDTSALIDFKSLIPGSDQWDVFKRFEELVSGGEIAMPRQVVNEVSKLAHPDVPGVWASGMRSRLQHPLDVDYVFIQRVMAEAGEVVDEGKAEEDADPYVVALALHLQSEGLEPCVVTSDVVDRPPIRIALTTACDRLGVAHVAPNEFLEAILVATKKPGR